MYYKKTRNERNETHFKQPGMIINLRRDALCLIR